MQRPLEGQKPPKGRVSDVIRARTSQWKPHKSELFTTLAPTRYGMTYYPDTRHITEPSVPFAHSHMDAQDRFKTTNNTLNMFSVPDHVTPQVEDQLKRHAVNEFRVERVRGRQRELAERTHA